MPIKWKIDGADIADANQPGGPPLLDSSGNLAVPVIARESSDGTDSQDVPLENEIVARNGTLAIGDALTPGGTEMATRAELLSRPPLTLLKPPNGFAATAFTTAIPIWTIGCTTSSGTYGVQWPDGTGADFASAANASYEGEFGGMHTTVVWGNITEVTIGADEHPILLADFSGQSAITSLQINGLGGPLNLTGCTGLQTLLVYGLGPGTLEGISDIAGLTSVICLGDLQQQSLTGELDLRGCPSLATLRLSMCGFTGLYLSDTAYAGSQNNLVFDCLSLTTLAIARLIITGALKAVANPALTTVDAAGLVLQGGSLELQRNALTADALNTIFSALDRTSTGTVCIYSNPGTATCNGSLLPAGVTLDIETDMSY